MLALSAYSCLSTDELNLDGGMLVPHPCRSTRIHREFCSSHSLYMLVLSYRKFGQENTLCHKSAMYLYDKQMTV